MALLDNLLLERFFCTRQVWYWIYSNHVTVHVVRGGHHLTVDVPVLQIVNRRTQEARVRYVYERMKGVNDAGFDAVGAVGDVDRGGT